MRRLTLGITWLLLSAIPYSGEAQQALEAQIPEPRIVRRWAGGAASAEAPEAVFEPSLIPVRLLLTPYQSWPQAIRAQVPIGVYDDFWQYVQSFDERGMLPKCLPPMISDTWEPGLKSGPPGTLTPVKLAKAFPVAVLGDLAYQEPAWDVQNRRVATLKYLKVDKILKNETHVPLAPDEIVTFVVSEGSAQIAGRTFCSLAAPRIFSGPSDNGTLVLGAKTFLLMGYLPSYQDKFLQTPELHIFRVVGSSLYPPPGVPAYGSVPMPLHEFISEL